MGPLKALIGAAVGGAIGAGIWAAVAYNMNLEIGWIAWGVGLLCGLGAMMAVRDDADHLTGGIAAVVAIASVAGGKYLAVHYFVQDFTAGMTQIELTDSDAQVYMADQLIPEYEASGTPLKWSEGMTAEDADTLDKYPENLQKDVLARWEAMSMGERESYRASVQATLRHDISSAIGAVESEGFFASFGPLDILFVFLAVATAFKLGSGGFGGDDD
jgi:hypothetical protein